jgi:hypothetical protein
MGASGLLRFLRKRALIHNAGDPWALAMFQEGVTVPGETKLTK